MRRKMSPEAPPPVSTALRDVWLEEEMAQQLGRLTEAGEKWARDTSRRIEDVAMRAYGEGLHDGWVQGRGAIVTAVPGGEALEAAAVRVLVERDAALAALRNFRKSNGHFGDCHPEFHEPDGARGVETIHSWCRDARRALGVPDA